jgi:methylisocitrate lyase
MAGDDVAPKFYSVLSSFPAVVLPCWAGEAAGACAGAVGVAQRERPSWGEGSGELVRRLPGKRLVTVDAMCRKIAAARKASDTLQICARTDALMVSMSEALDRALRYVEAGADIIFVEAMTTALEIRMVREALPVPLLGNMTEFGKTPQMPLRTWNDLGVNLVIYPVSALRISARAVEDFYGSLKAAGEVGDAMSKMMTRAELYKVIEYFEYEHLDESIAQTVLPS